MDESDLQPGTQVVALYSFDSNNEEDLVFQKDDIMTIVIPTCDTNWYKARHKDGHEGLVPVNYLKKRVCVKLSAMPWFHGKITREESEILFNSKEDGLFLVRESSNFLGDYVLSVCYNNAVEHYRVMYKEHSLTIDEEEYFENLSKLVEHYQNDADGLCTRLEKFVHKEGNLTASVVSQELVNAGWALAPENLELGEIISEGEFGDVVQGRFLGEAVAVKIFKDSDWKIQPFLVGISVLTSLNHKNVVQLRGVAFQYPSVHIVTEYMLKGSLLDYLRSNSNNQVTEEDQMNFAIDICTGMAYLESHQIVHRDLAARNIEVSSKNVAKIGGFGLARPKEFCDYSGHFPIKWTPPEALRRGVFSNKSDMWSFGILLWEIYTFGKTPYPNIPLVDIVEYIEKGHRLANPDKGPSEMYDIMLQTWNIEPEMRPNFEDLVKELVFLKYPWLRE